MKKPRTSRRYHVQFTWFGHSAFLLESVDGSSVLIDPWLDNPRAPAGTKDNVSPGLILISHGHSDHLGNAVEVANRSDAHVVAIHEVALYLTSKGIRNVTGINKGGTVSIAGVSVSMTDAKHSSSIDAEDPPIPGGDPAGFVVRFSDGFAVYHAGDTCLFGDMRYIQQLYKPDVAILPIGDLYTMGPKQAAIAAQLLKPKHIIAMHYGTVPALLGTPGELRENLPRSLRNRVVELTPGTPKKL